MTLGSDRASSKGYIVRWVEAPSNKLLTTAFEASLESVTVTCRLSVDSKVTGIASERRNPKRTRGPTSWSGWKATYVLIVILLDFADYLIYYTRKEVTYELLTHEYNYWR